MSISEEDFVGSCAVSETPDTYIFLLGSGRIEADKRGKIISMNFRLGPAMNNYDFTEILRTISAEAQNLRAATSLLEDHGFEVVCRTTTE